MSYKKQGQIFVHCFDNLGSLSCSSSLVTVLLFHTINSLDLELFEELQQ